MTSYATYEIQFVNMGATKEEFERAKEFALAQECSSYTGLTLAEMHDGGAYQWHGSQRDLARISLRDEMKGVIIAVYCMGEECESWAEYALEGQYEIQKGRVFYPPPSFFFRAYTPELSGQDLVDSL